MSDAPNNAFSRPPSAREIEAIRDLKSPWRSTARAIYQGRKAAAKL